MSQTLNIKGIKWKFTLVKEASKITSLIENQQAMCDKEKKVLYFQPKFLSKEVIRHELMHAYFSSCCLDSTNTMDQSDLEEIACEIVAYHLLEIEGNVNKIYSALKKKVK